MKLLRYIIRRLFCRHYLAHHQGIFEGCGDNLCRIGSWIEAKMGWYIVEDECT